MKIKDIYKNIHKYIIDYYLKVVSLSFWRDREIYVAPDFPVCFQSLTQCSASGWLPKVPHSWTLFDPLVALFQARLDPNSHSALWRRCGKARKEEWSHPSRSEAGSRRQWAAAGSLDCSALSALGSQRGVWLCGTVHFLLFWLCCFSFPVLRFFSEWIRVLFMCCYWAVYRALRDEVSAAIGCKYPQSSWVDHLVFLFGFFSCAMSLCR